MGGDRVLRTVITGVKGEIDYKTITSTRLYVGRFNGPHGHVIIISRISTSSASDKQCPAYTCTYVLIQKRSTYVCVWQGNDKGSKNRFSTAVPNARLEDFISPTESATSLLKACYTNYYIPNLLGDEDSTKFYGKLTESL